MSLNAEDIGREYKKQPSEKKDENISNLWDLLLKSGVTIDFASKLYQLCRTNFHFTSIDKLIELVSNSTDIPAILQVLKKLNFKEINDICGPICNGKIDATTKSQVIENLGKTKQDMANKLIKNAAITSTVLIAIQVGKLIMIWNEIKMANNIAKESQNSLHKIKEKVAELSKGIDEIRQIMEKYNESDNEAQKFKLSNRINRRISSLNSTYAETILLISDIKVKIGNSIERLALRQKDQIFDGISNLVNLVASLVQIASVEGSVSKGIEIFHGLTTTGYFGLCVANLTVYAITSNTLDNLRKAMNEVMKYERELFEIRKIINNVEEWLDKVDDDDSEDSVICKSHAANVRCFKCINSRKNEKKIIKLRKDGNVYGFK